MKPCSEGFRRRLMTAQKTAVNTIRGEPVMNKRAMNKRMPIFLVLLCAAVLSDAGEKHSM